MFSLEGHYQGRERIWNHFYIRPKIPPFSEEVGNSCGILGKAWLLVGMRHTLLPHRILSLKSPTKLTHIRITRCHPFLFRLWLRNPITLHIIIIITTLFSCSRFEPIMLTMGGRSGNVRVLIPGGRWHLQCRKTRDQQEWEAAQLPT